MPIDQDFVNAIKPIVTKLRNLVVGDFVLFGSAPLYLLGIRKFEGLGKMHDLDVTLDGHLKDENIAQVVYFENDPEQVLKKVTIDGFAVDLGCHWPGDDAYFNKIFDRPIISDGIKFANIDTVLEVKRNYAVKYNREKDRKAVAAIEEYLSLVRPSRLERLTASSAS